MRQRSGDQPRQRRHLSQEMTREKRGEHDDLLESALHEIETVMNYVTTSINPDSVRAREVKECLDEHIQ
jgi:hypothetical protein